MRNMRHDAQHHCTALQHQPQCHSTKKQHHGTRYNAAKPKQEQKAVPPPKKTLACCAMLQHPEQCCSIAQCRGTSRNAVAHCAMLPHITQCHSTKLCHCTKHNTVIVCWCCHRCVVINVDCIVVIVIIDANGRCWCRHCCDTENSAVAHCAMPRHIMQCHGTLRNAIAKKTAMT